MKLISQNHLRKISEIESQLNKDGINQYHIKVDHEDLKRTETPEKLDVFYWLGGGGVYILNNRYLALIKRDNNAKTNPNKLSLCTGTPDTSDELRNPALLLRELPEELGITDVTYFYYPDRPHVTEESLRDYYDGHPLFKGKLCKVSSIDIPSLNLGLDELIISIDDTIVHIDAYLALDDYTNTYNVVFPVFLEGVDFNVIKLHDMENIDLEGKRIFLNRKVYLYDLKEKELLEKNLSPALSKIVKTTHCEKVIKRLSKWYEVNNDKGNSRVLSEP